MIRGVLAVVMVLAVVGRVGDRFEGWLRLGEGSNGREGEADRWVAKVSSHPLMCSSS